MKKLLLSLITILMLVGIYVYCQFDNNLAFKIKMYDNDYSKILKTEKYNDFLCVLYESKDSQMKLIIFENNNFYGLSVSEDNYLNVFFTTDEFPMYIIYGDNIEQNSYYIYDTGISKINRECKGDYVLDIYVLKNTSNYQYNLGSGKCYSKHGTYLFDF